jgi:CubicO group peptidase (beta-lactamase class C family)
MNITRAVAGGFTAAVLVGCTVVGAQRSLDFGTVERSVLDDLAQTNTPGAALTVVKGDSVVFSKGFGIANAETASPMSADTVFYHGGLSMLFTATAVLSLAEEGKLNMDAPIGTYLTGLSAKLSRITAHQLLSSTGGIRERHEDRGNFDADTLRSTLRSWQDDWVFADAPTLYSDSHGSFALAGLLIQEVTGKSFAEAMEDRVFRPLGMRTCTYQPTVAMTFSLAQGHRAGRGQSASVVRPFAQNALGWPRDSFCSANDLSRMLLALVNDGRVGGRQVLSSTLVSKLLRAYSSLPGSGGEQAGYGLFFSQYGEHLIATNTTTWAGFRAEIRLVPGQRFAFAALSNTVTPLTRMTTTLVQMFLAGAQPSKGEAKLVPLSEAEAQRFVGMYENERAIHLFVRDGRLFFRDESLPPLRPLGNGSAIPVSKVGETELIVQPADDEAVHFVAIPAASGNVEYLFYGMRALRRTR